MTSDLSNDFSQFLSQFPLRRYPKGQMLVTPHDEPPCIYFIETGKVRKYDVTRYGDQVVMNVFGVSMLFPLPWVLNRTPNQYYYEALVPLTVRCIPTDEMNAYLKKDPALVYDLLQKVYAGLESTQRRVVYLTRGTARSRLLFDLQIEARRSGEMREDGSCVVTISETELADRAGLSRETISRELAKIFKHGDLCIRQGRSIVILDMDKLEEMLRKTA